MCDDYRARTGRYLRCKDCWKRNICTAKDREEYEKTGDCLHENFRW